MMGFGGFGGCCSYGTYGWLGIILNILFFVAVFGGMIGLVVWAVRRITGKNNDAGSSMAPLQSPRELLQARYVRGEIDREQYLSMLNDLETGRSV